MTDFNPYDLYKKCREAGFSSDEASIASDSLRKIQDLKETSEFNLKKYLRIVFLGIIVIFLLAILFFVIGYFSNHYNVWHSRMSGQASLSMAEGTRQIVTLEAKAKKESATELAQAEIIRAKGVAEANKIIGDSLKENEGYLRYLWIQSLEHSQGKVIYIPTEAGLPILESTRLKR